MAYRGDLSQRGSFLRLERLDGISNIATTVYCRLSIVDILGRDVVVLVDGERSSGSHVVTWDASSKPSGTYLVRLVAGSSTMVRKVALVR